MGWFRDNPWEAIRSKFVSQCRAGIVTLKKEGAGMASGEHTGRGNKNVQITENERERGKIRVRDQQVSCVQTFCFCVMEKDGKAIN